jgi:hypothetical protein
VITAPNGGSARGYQDHFAQLGVRERLSTQSASPHAYALPAPSTNARMRRVARLLRVCFCAANRRAVTAYFDWLAGDAARGHGKPGIGVWLEGRLAGYVACDPHAHAGP